MTNSRILSTTLLFIVLSTVCLRAQLLFVPLDTAGAGEGGGARYIKVVNTSTETMNVAKVECQRSDGKNLACSISKNELAPGDTGTVTAVFDYTDCMVQCKHDVVITVKNKQYVRTYRTDAGPDFYIVKKNGDVPQPYALVFETDSLKLGLEVERTFRIVNTGKTQLTISPPQYSAGNIRVRGATSDLLTIQPQKAAEITFYVTPISKEEENNGYRTKRVFATIEFTTSSTDSPRFNIQIVAGLSQ